VGFEVVVRVIQVVGNDVLTTFVYGFHALMHSRTKSARSNKHYLLEGQYNELRTILKSLDTLFLSPLLLSF
jgi:hypothetical protein